MNDIKLLLTFDYELPLGGVKESYLHSLFDPVDALLENTTLLKVPLVFFVDILSLVKFKEWDDASYVIPFTSQIEQIMRVGHDVQLHLHPHWLESSIEGGKITPGQRFRLGDFVADGEDKIDEIVKMGVRQMKEICGNVKPNYRCIAYRGGGFSLGPNTKEILTALYKCGIRIDSSISRGYYFKSDTSLVDYRKLPELPNWFLSRDGDFRTNNVDKKTLFEIPIASKPKGLFDVPTSFKMKKYAHRAVEDRGRMIHTHLGMSRKDRLRQMLSSRMLSVDNHTFSPAYLIKILDYNVKRFQPHDTIFLSLIGHPKSMGKYHYYLLTEFIKRAKDKYGEMLSFATFEEVYNQLNLEDS